MVSVRYCCRPYTSTVIQITCSISRNRKRTRNASFITKKFVRLKIYERNQIAKAFDNNNVKSKRKTNRMY